MGLRKAFQASASPWWLAPVAFLTSIGFAFLMGVCLWWVDRIHEEYTPAYDEASLKFSVLEIVSMGSLLVSLTGAVVCFVVALLALWDWLVHS